MRILVVEDEPSLAQTIAEGLRDAGYAVDVAQEGGDAWSKISVSSYDLVVLDRDLPGLHGDEICRRAREQSPHLRILMLTAAADVTDRVQGLVIGADDYLPKPFAFVELNARIQALLRRASTPARALLAVSDLLVDRDRREVTRAGRPLNLTAKEFAVLELLMEAEGRVLSAEELLERAWDEFADPFTNAVRVTMTRLRHKLGEPSLINTVIGSGYRIRT